MTKTKEPQIDIDKILFSKREIFLYDYVHDITSARIVKELLALDEINHSPISFYLNSGGGICSGGIAILNTIRMIKSPVITIINSQVASMGSHISIAGDKRLMVWNGEWMAHDIYGGGDDYCGKLVHRIEHMKKLESFLIENYKMYTKLTKKDLELAKNGELWLTADKCLEKGIVDEIIYP